MAKIDFQTIKQSALNDTIENIKKKKERNKSYAKLDLFSSKYYNIEGLSEWHIMEAVTFVVEELEKLGYSVDTDKNRIYWETKNETEV